MPVFLLQYQEAERAALAESTIIDALRRRLDQLDDEPAIPQRTLAPAGLTAKDYPDADGGESSD